MFPGPSEARRPVVECDRCETRFRGSWDILVLRDEARAAGWIGEMNQFPTSLSRLPDLCPKCQQGKV